MKPDRESGAYLAWFGVMVVTLLAFGALVIDLGALYSERRQLQNGADSAALAVAFSCQSTSCGGTTYADGYVDRNAKDGQGSIETLCGSGPGLSTCASTPSGLTGARGWVKVRDRTNNPGNAANPDQVKFLLAPIMNAAMSGSTVHADAVAAWGTVGTANLMPFVLGICEFTQLGGVIGTNSVPVSVPTGSKQIAVNAGTGNTTCPAGAGGFGWGNATSGCVVTIALNGSNEYWLLGSTGASIPAGCPASGTFADLVGTTMIIPMFDRTNALTGSNLEYHIIGFAGFVLEKYDLSGNGGGRVPSTFRCTNGEQHCIYGHFAYVTQNSGGFGTGVDLGARVVKLVG